MSADVLPLLRGVIDLISEKELREKIGPKKSLRVKLGVDPTSPDLHLGHTVILNKLKTFQELGHTIVFIIGDFTALIGDPSGRDETRPRISEADVEKNSQTYLDQAFKLLDKNKTEVHKNSTWLKKLFDPSSLLQKESLFSLFSRATVQQLSQREDFSQRLKAGHPVTLLELIYPLFQGYDSVAVKADVELGGSDQLFNLLMGRAIQKDFNLEPQVVMTLPLLVGIDGVKKMSKSYGNAIALNDAPKDIFGRLMSIPDELMWKYYELLTLEDLPKVKALHPKEAKMRLAQMVTERYHPGEGENAKAEFEQVFSKKDLPEEITDFKVTQRTMLLSRLVFEAGLAPSKRESKRLIENGGIRLDGKAAAEDTEIEILSPFILQVGRRKFVRILP